MRNRFFTRIVLGLLVALLTFSCDQKDEELITPNQKTLFMYMPWSDNLTGYFYQNIADMEEAVRTVGLNNERVIVFIASSETEGQMFEIKYISDGVADRPVLKTYEDIQLTTVDGIAEILRDLQQYAPALTYDMVIGCHGMGWIPVNSTQKTREIEKLHYQYDGPLMTRYFGGTSTSNQTDISTLADAIRSAGMKMEYILFDDCYMSSIEVAYDLRDVTDYLVASTCEVMAYGMPYAKMGQYLFGTTDYAKMCDEFYDFYISYSKMPCGTLAVTDCSEVENMAAVMREINAAHTFDYNQLDDIQALDGYSPTIFYDFGDYVQHLLGDDDVLRAKFETQLSRTVIQKVNTPTYYAAAVGHALPISTYSGLTISDPSESSRAADKMTTNWYIASH